MLRQKQITLNKEQLATLLSFAAGAISWPFMRDNPQYIMPSRELSDIIDRITDDYFPE